MDAFFAGGQTGENGEVVGVDMTAEQLAKAPRLAQRDGFARVRFEQGYVEEAPISDSWADVVISNGVINLCVDKPAVFREITRILRPGGRMAIPIGSPFQTQILMLIEKTADGELITHQVLPVMFVPVTGSH